MPELYKDWIPPDEKAPASQSGQYQDWVPPEDFNEAEARVMTPAERGVAVAELPPVDPEPTAPPEKEAPEPFQCKKCLQAGETKLFPSLSELMRHHYYEHQKPKEQVNG